MIIRPLTTAGQEALVEIVLRRDVAEWWWDDSCRAVFDRQGLRAWLAHPIHALVLDEVMLAPLARGHVAISVAGVIGPWMLTPDELEQLRGRV